MKDVQHPRRPGKCKQNHNAIPHHPPGRPDQTASVDGDVEKPSPSSLLVGVGNDALRQFLKMLEATGIPLLSVHPKELKPYPHKNIYTTNILSIIQSRQEMEITQVSIIHSLVNE